MKETIEKYIKENAKEYIILIVFLLIGLVLGVIVANNSNQVQKDSITTTILNVTNTIKQTPNIDYGHLLIESIKKNVILESVIFFFSLSVLAPIIIKGIVCYKGFCLGYTISSVILTFGIGKGLLFCLPLLFITQLILIPCLLILANEGNKLYKSIVIERDSRMKIQITKTLIIFLSIFGVLFITSCIETYLCSNLFVSITKYL